MFYQAYAFDQDLGWCVDDGMSLWRVFEDTLCESTSCGVAQPENYGDCNVASTGNVMVNHKLRRAVSAWLADATAAETTYGHISTWATGGVTDMSWLFCVRQDYMDDDWYNDCINADASFNEDIGAWDVSGVTTMYMMFDGNSAFDQDLGWCVDDGVDLWGAFSYSGCSSTSCGVVQVADVADCPTPAPTTAPSPAPTTPAPTVAPTLAPTGPTVAPTPAPAGALGSDAAPKDQFISFGALLGAAAFLML
jgi:hypothetical protein